MNEVEAGRLNRRAFLRVPSAMPCKLACLRPDGSLPEDGWADAEIVEIGGGGARVETTLEVEMGCVLSLRLQVPDTGHTIRLSAPYNFIPKKKIYPGFCRVPKGVGPQSGPMGCNEQFSLDLCHSL